MSYKDLLYIHRSYAGAALRAEGDPLAHAFAPSVLAVYRSSCQIVTGVKDLMGKHQELLAECWFFWKQRALTQKHQRQDTLSVRAPPRIGPTTEAIPNMLDNAAT